MRGRALTLAVPPPANFDRSDQAPFWRAGVPAVLITDTAWFRNANYHAATDTPTTLDYHRLALVADACVACGSARTLTP